MFDTTRQIYLSTFVFVKNNVTITRRLRASISGVVDMGDGTVAGVDGRDNICFCVARDPRRLVASASV